MADDPATGESLHSILVLCTHNAVRSVMAQAMLRAAFGVNVYVTSAGCVADETPNHFATQAMQEIGMDISGHTPRNWADMEDAGSFDMIIALSQPAYSLAHEIAKDQPASVEYWETPEPPGVMAGLSQGQMMEAYRRLREDLRTHIQNRFDVKVRSKSGLQ